MIFLVYMLIVRRYHLLQPGFKLIFTKTETAYTRCLSQFRKRRQSVKTQASDCIHLFPLSPTPTGLLPALCVLFTWLTCSVHAGSFVHQKAPAPGDCLLTFLSRALQMSVSSLFLSPPFCYFSTLMKCLPGWRLPVQTSGWLVIPRQACLIKSHWISSLHYVYHIWRRYFVETHASVCKPGNSVLLKDITKCSSLDRYTARYCWGRSCKLPSTVCLWNQTDIKLCWPCRLYKVNLEYE